MYPQRAAKTSIRPYAIVAGEISSMRRTLGFIVGLSCLNAVHAAEATGDYVVAYSETHPFAAGLGAFLTEAYRRVGQPITLKAFPPGRSVELANRGEVDAEAARVPDAMDRMTGLIVVPEPLGLGDTFAYTTGRDIPIEGWESLRGYRLCVMLGDLITMRRTEGMTREVAHDGTSQFRMLASGRCEVAISDGAAWLVIDRQHLGRFRMMDRPIQSAPIYHYVNRRHAELVTPLALAFKTLREEGFSQSLLTPYLAQIRESRARNSVQP